MTMFDSGLCDWLVLPLLLPTPTTQFSLDHKRRSRKRNWKKWKRSDSSDSDFVELITLLTTPSFDFHQVISSLMTPTLVKTSLKWFTSTSYSQNYSKIYKQMLKIVCRRRSKGKERKKHTFLDHRCDNLVFSFFILYYNLMAKKYSHVRGFGLCFLPSQPTNEWFANSIHFKVALKLQRLDIFNKPLPKITPDSYRDLYQWFN